MPGSHSTPAIDKGRGLGHRSAMPAVTPARADALLKDRSFLFFLLSRSLSRFASQISAVAIGWQIYDMTGSAFDLGMVGFVQFLPTAILLFVAGHAADRFERKRVVQLCQLVEVLTALFLAVSTYAGTLTEIQIFIATFVLGIAGAFESPALAALLPLVAPQGSLQRATAISSGAAQVATITGPAIGGLAFAIAPSLPYAIMAAFLAFAALFMGAISATQPVVVRDTATPDDLFAGVRFVRNNPSILGTISLDLFAVLLGGATALLPIYARDILQTGPLGLGILRAAPAVGALLMTAYLARHNIERRVGMRMFQAVIVFGAATVVFGLSHWMWLSVLSLAILGAADTISVVIRFSLVQLATPDEMRGRVGAVNFLFINASNQLGQFESGITAALFGAVPAAVLGGVGTIAIALLWMKLFPTLRNVERLE
ncbi:Predicted arabinose efflux permease, MFS family [Bradyrhizobium lablabi]|jgi:MFS family permease|uniref:Predicted arabinose efflux permease, MFS family n=3 Tax=Nitrobacteraceae TaxID=41294 RepID=A0ABY0QBI8_9BRAD|nr:Predicted arabinose efflux permease, MFS family [Bradyrhizobium ottawaense]SEC05613.1 Predicted arabinose efflux permease, MFS family [Bradyrhizobium lablabi]SHM71367.1 Predicted arabinose efflux permease, MFS family [Bradyrhizobium lablabi]